MWHKSTYFAHLDSSFSKGSRMRLMERGRFSGRVARLRQSALMFLLLVGSGEGVLVAGALDVS